MPQSYPGYQVFPVGDRALVIHYGNVIDISVHKRIIAIFHHIQKNFPEGVIEIAPAYSSLFVQYDVLYLLKKESSLSAYKQAKILIEKIIDGVIAGEVMKSRLVRIPVCYDKELGIDLEEVAKEKNITPDEVIKLHCAQIYHVFMLGFLPGFAYMGEVDERIAVPRHSKPRKHIEAGSVGVAGKQTGIYPLHSPGGWQILGRTPVKLFNPGRNEPGKENEISTPLTLLNPGDEVQFYPINKEEYLKIQSEHSGKVINTSSHTNESSKGITILKAGIYDTVQDTGRYGYQHLGINPGGAMDVFSLKAANILAGNDPATPALELFFPAAEISFEQDTLAALSGADFDPEINGNKIKINHSLFIKKGDVLRFKKPTRGNCCYLAVRGGFDIPPWLGSTSTHIKAGAGGFCGRVVRKGDRLTFHPSISIPENTDISFGFTSPVLFSDYNPEDEKIFVVEGKEWRSLAAESKERFYNEIFTITSYADKMGYRLSGHLLSRNNNKELVSSAVTFGTIQLLPDGQLIVLMADHQTTGGYPAIAHVITAHHSLLAQKRPGDKIRFEITDIKTAEDLLLQQHEFLLQLQKAAKFSLSSG